MRVWLVELIINPLKNNKMIQLALLVTLEAKPGKETEVEQFLLKGLELVEQEPNTITWYALKIEFGKYAIFDTFEGEEGRKAHLSGEVAKALMQKADDLFATPPKIEMVDLIAAKQEIIHSF